MAHFAKINPDTKEVLAILYVNDVDVLDENGIEKESIGQQYLENHNNWPANLWIQTSYNTINNTHKDGKTPFRGNYAAIGFIWDENNQIFWPPKPYNSWVKDVSTASWISPIGKEPELTEEQKNQYYIGTHTWIYVWNEDNQTWNLTNFKI
jgi:hypothetical protein